MPKRTRPARVLVATQGDRLIATAQAFPLRQWFGGRPVPTAGIASVATSPLHRGAGVGTAIMESLMAKAGSEGQVMASLYPATVPVYRRLGFELAGTYTQYRMKMEALPPAKVPQLRDVPEDGGPIRESYLRLAERENGLTEGADDDWWPWRVLGAHDPDPHGAVMTGEGVPDGYAAYSQERLEDWGYRIECTHFVAHTREAALGLLAHFRRFKGVGMELQIQGPPVEPLALLLPEDTLLPSWTFRNMSRILDVQGALEARGYPDVSGAASFAVADPLFPQNDGQFAIEAEDGKVRVGKDRSAFAGEPISTGALSTMLAGHVHPRAAAAIGLIPGDHPALELFAQLFAGPAPWTPDFF